MTATHQKAPVVASSDDVALDVCGLSIDIRRPQDTVRAVDDLTFRARRGETVALLGESGCGKSLTAQAIVGLLAPVAEIAEGSVLLGDLDLVKASPKLRRQNAGPGLAIVFQDALTTLNPVYTVGYQLAEPFRIHRGLSRKAARAEAIELMHRVGIPEPQTRIDSYPHQFSGGMRQRLLIAIAVALSPAVLLADEPTTALDVTVQAQIMQLLKDLRTERNMALVLITHDLALVSEEADRVVIMYAGNVVEQGPVSEVFGSPKHPYTKGLLDSVPAGAQRGSDLPSIGGKPPELHAIPAACVYQDRCPLVQDICRQEKPTLRETAPDHKSACHFAEEVAR
jgi:peptide/nickel transport system ATP-binding protein/oligopeptide transport system ATP-binding protein